MSLGDLTEEHVEQIRAGKPPNPSMNQVVTLADVFGVHPSYFLDPTRRPPLLDEEAMRIFQDETVSAIAHKSLHLPGRERQMILNIIQQFEDTQGAEVKADAPKRGSSIGFGAKIETLWRHFRDRAVRAREPTDRDHCSRPQSFRRNWLSWACRAGGSYPKITQKLSGIIWNISIAIHVIPDDWYPELSRRLAISGRLGELHYSEQLTLAAIFVPGSLPPLVSTLTILHELGHLAAGDLLIEPSEEASGPHHRMSRGRTFTTSPPRKVRSSREAFRLQRRHSGSARPT